MHTLWNNFLKVLPLWIFFGIVSAALLATLAPPYYIPNSNDFINHIASIIQAKAALLEGQFPLRDTSFLGRERYPLYQFYAPTSYLFAALVDHWLTSNNPYLAYKITLWIAVTIGGISMQAFSAWFLHSYRAGILTSLLYLCSPYYLIVNNHLFGFNEGIALGILPLALYSTFKLYCEPFKLLYLIGTSLAWYCILTTHLITFIYSSCIVGFLFLVITLKNKHHITKLLLLALSYSYTCLLGAWFLIPIQKLAHNFWITSSFDNGKTLLHLSPSLLSLMAYTSNYLFNVNPHISAYIMPAAGWLLYVGAILSLLIRFDKQFSGMQSGSKRAYYWIPYLGLAFILAFFIAWSPFNFWPYVPSALKVGQYPWRLLSQTSWIGALLGGTVICWLCRNTLSDFHLAVGTFFILLCTASWIPLIDKEYIPIPPNLVKQPRLILNETSYFMDGANHPELVDSIDNYVLDTAVIQHKLVLDSAYYLPKALLMLTQQPSLALKGTIPHLNSPAELIIKLDHTVLATKKLTSGSFNWTIPLNLHMPLQDTYSLTFSVTSSGSKDTKHAPVIEADNVVLNGFINPKQVLTQDNTAKQCTPIKNITVCHLTTSTDINLIELPVNYYPELLQIKADGKPVAYQSMMRFNQLFAAIKVAPGTTHTIEAEFVGLVWANRLSDIAWLSIVLLSLYAFCHYWIVSDKDSVKNKPND